MDRFADIAAKGIGGNQDLLALSRPLPHQVRLCPLEKTADDPLFVPPHMSTAEELSEALSRERARFAPYLRDLAPKISSLREKIEIPSFRRDGQIVSVPEYGGPIGACQKTYETSFSLPGKLKGRSVYIHFEAADYRAVVYVNGEFAGEHEGFFAPFEFDITSLVKPADNQLKVELFNDHIYMGNDPSGEEETEGDKLYAATGLGWDGPVDGWHHCPAGMGICGRVFIEIRHPVHISDLYIRPMKEAAQVWVEIQNDTYQTMPAEISLSVYGQNFHQTVCEDLRYVPHTSRYVGLGDTLTQASAGSTLGKDFPLPLKHGKNLYQITVPIPDPKWWEPDHPYLYQAQAAIFLDGQKTDTASQAFGMRLFTQDTSTSGRKGMFYLNGRPVRLRGANTMGAFQQDVMRGDVSQLIDDLLLAKIAHLNFLRFTQRPVQEEIYDYCDRLGLMAQTDLPLFGCMRRFRVPEAIRQAEEMERIVRKHPSNVLITYINEPFPNANNEPHRHLRRDELESFFACCDSVVRLSHPDQVIKHVDGDYDPPSSDMPDNHCYTMWYNGHGIDAGLLYQGYWMPVKPGWYYGCGEYGAEGLDPWPLMKDLYPKEWLQEPFDPSRIVRSQTGSFHGFFYDTPQKAQDWVRSSQAYQAFADRFMTEAFRRDDRMVSTAVHLFIDAWPSGWMKAVMDCRREPKPAYFALRDALEPLHISLRTDRHAFFAGEEVHIEAYLCNDTPLDQEGQLVFELYGEDRQLRLKGDFKVRGKACHAAYVGEACFDACTGKDREELTVKAILLDGRDEPVTCTEEKITVFQDVVIPENPDLVMVTGLTPGVHQIAGETVVVKPCGMSPVHFVSRNTGHPAVAEFKEFDFSYWYDKKAGRITPLLSCTFTAPSFTPILLSWNTDENGKWGPALAAAEKVFEGKRYVICLVDLRRDEPVCRRFLADLYALPPV